MKQFLISLLLTVFSLPVFAAEAEYVGGDPELQARVMNVAGELRCLVCQGQSLADSNSKFAVDMRDYIRDMMSEGKSNQEVVDFMVQRYGDYVRYRPPLKSTTVLLWFGPFLLLGIGIVVLRSNVLRRKKKIQQDVPLSAEEHRRAAELLGRQDGDA